jgi:CheY-like chemotaxis protein
MKASNILIVEDSPEDFEAISEALIRAGLAQNQILHFNNGMELSDFIKQSRKQRVPPRPAVILLDLNLPGPNGHAILTQIRNDEQLAPTPVVLFSTSSSPRDINLAYAKGANSYLIKPMSLDEMDVLMARFKAYWFETVIPPLSAC